MMAFSIYVSFRIFFRCWYSNKSAINCTNNSWKGINFKKCFLIFSILLPIGHCMNLEASLHNACVTRRTVLIAVAFPIPNLVCIDLKWYYDSNFLQILKISNINIIIHTYMNLALPCAIKQLKVASLV